MLAIATVVATMVGLITARLVCLSLSLVRILVVAPVTSIWASHDSSMAFLEIMTGFLGNANRLRGADARSSVVLN